LLLTHPRGSTKGERDGCFYRKIVANWTQMGLYDQYNDEDLINRLHKEPPNVATAMKAELRQRQWNKSNDSLTGINLEITKVKLEIATTGQNVVEIKNDQRKIHKVHYLILVFAVIASIPVLLDALEWILGLFHKK
jgi:hypothetical protein